MKKIIALFIFLATTAGLYAQSADDAFSFSQERYEGTARTMSMGNAFTALGGDLGALGINPASSGVFRCSQFTVTPTLTTTRSNVNYLGQTNNTVGTGLNMSNLGLVLTFETGNYNGLLNYNFGIVYNKKNNFRSKMSAAGSTDNSSMLSALADQLGVVYNGVGITKESLDPSANPYTNYSADLWPNILAWNAYALAPLYFNPEETDYMYIASTENFDEGSQEIRIGGLLNQQFNRKTYGGVSEVTLNFGGNVNDFLYFGVNLNLNTLNQTTEEYYEEKAQNSNNFQDGFVSMDNSYWLHTSGTGASFKFGVILTPVAGLRIGATLTTPTWYKLTDEWDWTMNTAFNNGNTYTKYSPTGTFSYKLTTPMRWSLGLAYTFSDRALISADYENVNYASMRYKNENGSTGNFSTQNLEIKNDFHNASVLRLGTEVRVNRLISLRAGFQNYWSAAVGIPTLRVYSAGIGFNIGERASIDLAYNRTSTSANKFWLYENYDNVLAPTGINRSGMSQVACTFGLKF